MDSPPKSSATGIAASGIALGDQPADDPVEGQIAEIAVVPGDLVDAGHCGEIVIAGQTGHARRP